MNIVFYYENLYKLWCYRCLDGNFEGHKTLQEQNCQKKTNCRSIRASAHLATDKVVRLQPLTFCSLQPALILRQWKRRQQNQMKKHCFWNWHFHQRLSSDRMEQKQKRQLNGWSSAHCCFQLGQLYATRTSEIPTKHNRLHAIPHIETTNWMHVQRSTLKLCHYCACFQASYNCWSSQLPETQTTDLSKIIIYT